MLYSSFNFFVLPEKKNEVLKGEEQDRDLNKYHEMLISHRKKSKRSELGHVYTYPETCENRDIGNRYIDIFLTVFT